MSSLTLYDGGSITPHEKGCLRNQTLDRNPAAVYLARLAPNSRVVQRSALDTITRLLGGTDALGTPWQHLRYQHTALVRSQLAETYAPKTANRMLAALRGVLREAWRLGLLSVEDCERACDLKPIRGHRLPAGRALLPTEMTALLGTCAGESPPDRRDAALFALLYSGGLRRAEAAALDTSDYDPAAGSMLIRKGKNNKERRVYLADFATERIDSYLEACCLTNLLSGPLFRRCIKGNTLTADRLTDSGIRVILRRRCEQAGIPPISPHSMRRTMISDLLDNGVDLATVQRIAGHSSPSTTSAYDRRGDDAQKRAAGRLRIG